jgi:hypothetical protein
MADPSGALPDIRIVEIEHGSGSGSSTSPVASGQFHAGARMATVSRGPRLALAAASAFLAVAVVKPWPSAEPINRPSPTPVPIVEAARPTRPPEPESLANECPDPLGWRVYSHAVWTDEHVRTWHLVEPVVTAKGPLDAAIPIVEVGTGTTALGYCSPWTGTERPPADASVVAWQILEDSTGLRAAPLALQSIAPAQPSVLGALYRPPPTPAAFATPEPNVSADSRLWTPGRLVFAIEADGWRRWWSVVVSPTRTADLAAPDRRP